MSRLKFWGPGGLVEPLPKQKIFLKTAREHRFTLYGGARGPGKSYILRWNGIFELIRLAKAGIPGPVGGLFCEDYPTLRDRQIAKINTEVPAWLGRVKESRTHGLGFHLKPEYGGGVLLLRNLDDPTKYQGAEMAFILVDELTKNTIEVFDALRGSLRFPGVPEPRFMAATNPGSRGHVWVKRLWIDRDYSGDMERFANLSHEFAYVKALPSDNPHLTPQYWEDLRSQPEAVQKAWIHGMWDSFAGQFFEEWDATLHTVAPFDIPQWWTRVAGMDWGYDPHWGVVLLGAVDPHGRIWLYKELKFRRMSATAVGEKLADWLEHEAERQVTIVGDTQMWTTQPDRGVSIADDINDALSRAGLRAALVPANKDRINGWMRVHQWLDTRRPDPEDSSRSAPFLRIFQPDPSRNLGCPYLIATIPAQTHDEKKPGDLEKNSDDHALDTLRYMLMAREPLTQVPLEVRGYRTHRERLREAKRRTMKRLMAAQEQNQDVEGEMMPLADWDDENSEIWEDVWS